MIPTVDEWQAKLARVQRRTHQQMKIIGRWELPLLQIQRTTLNISVGRETRRSHCIYIQRKSMIELPVIEYIETFRRGI